MNGFRSYATRLAAFAAIFLALFPLANVGAAPPIPIISTSHSSAAFHGALQHWALGVGKGRRVLLHRSVLIHGAAGEARRFSPTFIHGLRAAARQIGPRLNPRRAVDYGEIVAVRAGEIVVRQEMPFHVTRAFHNATPLYSLSGLGPQIALVKIARETLVSVPGKGSQVIRRHGSTAGLRVGATVAAAGSLSAGGLTAVAVAELSPSSVRAVSRAAIKDGRLSVHHFTLGATTSKRFLHSDDVSSSQSQPGQFEGCIPDRYCVANQYTNIQETFTAPNQEDQGGLKLYDDGTTQIYLQSVGYTLNFDDFTYSWPMMFQATAPDTMYQNQQSAIDLSVQPQQITAGPYTFAGGLGISYAANFNVSIAGSTYQTTASAGVGVTNTTSDPAPLAGSSLDVGAVQCMELAGLDVKGVVSLASASICFNIHFDGANVGVRYNPAGAELVNEVGNPISSPAPGQLSGTPEPLWVVPHQNNWSLGLDQFYWAPKMTLQGYIQLAADPGIGPANVQCSCLTWNSPALSFPGYPQNIPMVDTIPNDPYAQQQYVHLGGPDGPQTSSVTYSYTSPPAPTVLSYEGATDFKTGNFLTVGANLVDNQGTPVVGADINFDLNGDTCDGSTDALGNASCYINIMNLGPGTGTLMASFGGGNGYLPSTATPTVSLSATSLTMTYVGDTKAIASNNARFAVDIQGLNTPIDAQTPDIATLGVTFYVNGQKMCTPDYTDAETAYWVQPGVLRYQCSGFLGSPAGPGLVAGFPSGAYTVSAVFAPNNYFTMDSVTAPFVISPRQTTLSYTGPSTAPYHGAVTLSSTLSAQDGGSPANAQAIYTLGSGAQSQSCQGTIGGDQSSCTLDAINLPPGTYPVSVVFLGNATFSGSSTTASLTVTKGTSTLTYTGPSTVSYHAKGIALSATLTQPNSSVNIVGQVVHFTLGNQSCDGTTNAKGEADCEIGQITQGPGAQLTITYDGNDLYTGTSITPPFSITQAPSTLTYTGATSAVYHGSLVMSATLTEAQGGAPLANQTVHFTLGTGAGSQSCDGTTDALGNASCTVSPIDVTPGSITAGASFDGNVDYKGSADSATFTLNKADVHLTNTGVTSADYGDSVMLSGTLAEGADGSGPAVANQPITFTLGTQSCVGTTDSNGNASCVLAGVTQTPGSATLGASFAGNADYNAGSASTTFQIKQEDTTLRYTSPQQTVATGQSITLTAILTDAADASEGESAATPIAGETVALSLGSQSCTGTTQPDGTVSCTIASVNQQDGNQAAGATFAGDQSYLGATDSGHQVLVYSFTSGGGVFVLGDRSVAGATSSTPLTFWGAQWSSQNSLSGGSASPSFKGYASGITGSALTCGTTWTASPGNSASPPATVPAYMAVAVTGNVTRSGSTISGTVTKVVVVKTNPGYGPDPGKTGTGTVVATLCGS